MKRVVRLGIFNIVLYTELLKKDQVVCSACADGEPGHGGVSRRRRRRRRLNEGRQEQGGAVQAADANQGHILQAPHAEQALTDG